MVAQGQFPAPVHGQYLRQVEQVAQSMGQVGQALLVGERAVIKAAVLGQVVETLHSLMVAVAVVVMLVVLGEPQVAVLVQQTEVDQRQPVREELAEIMVAAAAGATGTVAAVLVLVVAR